jgi:hypothetical protein
MQRLVTAGLLPERAGQPVKVWAHISLADLLRLDGSSALQEQWTAQVRAAWAARRAAASEGGGDSGAWLDGDAAEAIACDAAMAPIVTGDINIDALEDLVRLCVELDARRDGARDAVKDCVLLCWFHHQVVIHRWGWTLVLNPDGTTTAWNKDKTKVLHSHGPPVRPG